jgi:O-antigen/teichoic acid export membrane protein
MSPAVSDAEGAPAGDVLTAATAGAKVIRGSAWRLVSNGAGIVLGLGTAALLLRHLGVAESGRYVTVLSILAVPTFVGDSGLNVAASRELALRGPGDRRLVANILGQKLVVMPVMVLLSVGFAAVAGYPARMVIGTALAGTGIAIFALANVLVLRLTVELRNVWPAVLDFVRQVVGLAGAALLVVLGAGLTPFFAVLIAGSLTVVALVPFAAGPNAFIAPRFDRAEQRVLMATALPMATALTLAQLYFRLVIVLMSLISSAQQTGYFGGSLRATESLVIMPILIAGVALPLLTAAARDDMARLRAAVKGLGEATLIAGVLLVLVTVRAAEPVMVLIGGHAFQSAGAVLRIQVGTLVFLALDQIWAASLLALGRQRELIVTNAIALVGVAAFAAVLVPAYKAIGGAEASVLGELLLACLIYWRLSRAAGRVMVSTAFAVRLIAAAAVGSIALVVPGLPDLAAAALSGLLFLGTGQLIGLIPKEIHDAIDLGRLLGRRDPPAA